VLCKWLKLKKILVHVLPKRLLLICRRTIYLECPIGTIICKQGDPGDAFYVVLSGSLEVVINGKYE
jgi:CRP-like cAMP-binding protein